MIFSFRLRRFFRQLITALLVLAVAGAALLLIPAYYLAAVVVYLIWLFTTVLLTDGTNPSPRLVRFYHLCEIHILNWLLILLGIRHRVAGEEKIPADRPYLLVCNHRSAFDPLCTAAALTDVDMVFVAKPGIFRIPVIGTVLRKLCFLPIDRENPRNAVTTIKRAAELIQQVGLSVAIYPEGTRNKESEALLPFHAGSFKIAKLADCPVVAATVRYEKRFLLEKRVLLRMVDVMDAAFVAENNTATLSDRAKEKIEEDLK